MQLYAVNFSPLLSSLYMFRGAISAHHQEYNVQLYLQPLVKAIVSSQIVTVTCSQCCLALTSKCQCSTVSTATGTNHSVVTDRHCYLLPVWPGTQCQATLGASNNDDL